MKRIVRVLNRIERMRGNEIKTVFVYSVAVYVCFVVLESLFEEITDIHVNIVVNIVVSAICFLAPLFPYILRGVKKIYRIASKINHLTIFV